MVAVLEVLFLGSAQIPLALIVLYMWQITTDLETGVMVAVLEILYLGSAQIPQALIEVLVFYILFYSFFNTVKMGNFDPVRLHRPL